MNSGSMLFTPGSAAQTTAVQESGTYGDEGKAARRGGAGGFAV